MMETSTTTTSSTSATRRRSSGGKKGKTFVYLWGDLKACGDFSQTTVEPPDREGVLPYPTEIRGSDGAIQCSVGNGIVGFIKSDGVAFTLGQGR